MADNRHLGNPELRAFGEAVRTLRRKLGLTQQQLAERAGFERSYAGFLEQGRVNPTLVTVATTARALGVSIAGLLAAAEAQGGAS